MNDKEIKEIVTSGSIEVFTFDPNLKSEINRLGLDRMTRAVRNSFYKHRMKVLVVRQY
jgi:hypothetical protein